MSSFELDPAVSGNNKLAKSSKLLSSSLVHERVLSKFANRSSEVKYMRISNKSESKFCGYTNCPGIKAGGILISCGVNIDQFGNGNTSSSSLSWRRCKKEIHIECAHDKDSLYCILGDENEDDVLTVLCESHEKPLRYCKCKNVFEENKPMVLCNSCLDWFHFKCIGVEPNEISDDEIYTCDDCQEVPICLLV